MRLDLRGVLVGLALSACGERAQTPPPPSSWAPAPTVVDTPLPPEPPLPPNEAACPASFANALPHDGETCTGALPRRCSYAEGTCECVGWWSECRGARVSAPLRVPGHEDDPPSAEELGQWRCTPRPPARRADGCPRDMPPQGFACSGTPRTCGYGGAPSCCSTELTCVDGAWVHGPTQCLP